MNYKSTDTATLEVLASVADKARYNLTCAALCMDGEEKEKTLQLAKQKELEVREIQNILLNRKLFG